MKRSGQFVIPVLLLLGLAVLGFDLMIDTATLALTNRSDIAVSDLNVRVSGQEYHVGILALGATKTLTVHHYTDSSWRVTARWGSATMVDEHFGYITHSVDYEDTVEFAAGGEIRSSSVIP